MELVHLSGWLALLALLASLGVSLASRWVRASRARLLAGRRTLGLTAFALGVLHLVVTMSGLLAPRSAAEAAGLFAGLPYLRHGALALALLTPLVATSFPRLNTRLGLRTWSALHRLVYAALALAVLHVLCGPSADPRLALVLALVGALLLVARLTPTRRPPASGAAADLERDDELTTGSGDSP